MTLDTAAIGFFGRRIVLLIGLLPLVGGGNIASAQSGGISIMSPAAGTTVSPGQRVSVAIAGRDGFTPVSGLILLPSGASEVSLPNLSTVVTVPATAAGPLTIAGFGKNASGRILSSSVTIQVVPQSTLSDLTVNPASIVITGDTAGISQISVTGRYSDGQSRDITSGTLGTTYSSNNPAVATVDANGLMRGVSVGNATILVTNNGKSAAIPVTVTAQPNVLVSAVLPASRSVRIGQTATAFATVINGGRAATGCSIDTLSNVPGDFSFQATDPATNAAVGKANDPIDIPAGAAQSFIIAVTPTGKFDSIDMPLSFACADTTAADIVVGLNTLLLSASDQPVPDIIALVASTVPGVVELPGAAGTGAFAVATINVGASSGIVATADTGGASLPVSLSLCQTDPITGRCITPIGPSVSATINSNKTPTFAVFVAGSGTVPFSPADNRIFVRFKDAAGITRGSTSVAVRTR